MSFKYEIYMQDTYEISLYMVSLNKVKIWLPNVAKYVVMACECEFLKVMFIVVSILNSMINII